MSPQAFSRKEALQNKRFGAPTFRGVRCPSCCLNSLGYTITSKDTAVQRERYYEASNLRISVVIHYSPPTGRFLVKIPQENKVCQRLDRRDKIANRQSLAILDRGLRMPGPRQPFSQFCCLPMFKTNRQSRHFRIAISNRRDASDSNRAFLNR